MPPPPENRAGAQPAAIALGMVVVFLALAGLVSANPASIPSWLRSSDQLAICLFAAGLMMSIAETVRSRPWAAGERVSRNLAEVWRTAACRWVGLQLVLLTIGTLYWLLPEYRRPLYVPYFQATEWVVPLITGLSLPYYLLLEHWRMGSRDMVFAIGATAVSRRIVRSEESVSQFLLGWLVKAFFLPLMFCYAHQNLVFFQNLALNPIKGDIAFATWVQWIITALFLLDLCWACIGYGWALRITGSHIRSTDPSPLSWAVTLACYEPWARLVGAAYLATSDAHRWATWLPPEHFLHHVWGCTIVVLIGIYTASTVAFGLRFSNLTHRGIITWGPYRYCRHPAYLSKNLSWWMIGVPFAAASSTEEAVRNCLMLLGLNAVYWMRARTEEAHLGTDPAYRAYCAGVEQRRRALTAGWRQKIT